MRDILEKEYSKLKREKITPTGKVNLLNNIVQFKIHEPEYQNYNNDLSIDIKRYLNSLVELAENGARNYDIINTDNILFLNEVPFDDRVKYIDYFIRILEKSAFKDDIKQLQKIKYKTILTHSSSNIWSVKSVFRIFIYFPIYSFWSLLISLLIITVVTCAILLPAPFAFMNWVNYEIEYLPIAENQMFNHYINVTSSLIGVNEKFSITPTDSKSMILMILGRVFIFVYVVTLIFNKLTDLIKR